MRIGRLAIISFAASAFLGLAVAPANAGPVPRVVMIGDSLAYQMCGGDSQAIPTREVSVIDGGCYGWSGSTSGGFVRQMREPGWIDPGNVSRSTQRFDLASAVRSADVVVVSLGSNNAMRQEPTQYLAWDIGNIQSMLKPGARLVWFDVGMRPDSAKPVMNAAQFASAIAQDDTLWREARRYPNMTVLPWGGRAGADKGLLLDDGLHLTQAGWAARWRMVRDAIQS